MATMNVSLPGAMKALVEAQTEYGRYSNVSEYIRDLIRRDQNRQERIAFMQALATNGLESGVSERSMDDLREAFAEG